MPVFCRNPIDWYRGTGFDVLCLPMDAYCCNGVSVRRFVVEVEVGLTKKRPQAKLGKRAYLILLNYNCRLDFYK